MKQKTLIILLGLFLIPTLNAARWFEPQMPQTSLTQDYVEKIVEKTPGAEKLTQQEKQSIIKKIQLWVKQHPGKTIAMVTTLIGTVVLLAASFKYRTNISGKLKSWFGKSQAGDTGTEQIPQPSQDQPIVGGNPVETEKEKEIKILENDLSKTPDYKFLINGIPNEPGEALATIHLAIETRNSLIDQNNKNIQILKKSIEDLGKNNKRNIPSENQLEKLKTQVAMDEKYLSYLQKRKELLEAK